MALKDVNGPSESGEAEKGKVVDSKQRKSMTEGH